MDPALVKYSKMLKMGIPPPAVKQKMVKDGVEQVKIDNFFMDIAAGEGGDSKAEAKAEEGKDPKAAAPTKNPKFAKYVTFPSFLPFFLSSSLSSFLFSFLPSFLPSLFT
jgi:hypothetical protein